MKKTSLFLAVLVLQAASASAEQYYEVEPVTEKVVLNGSDAYQDRLNATQDLLLSAKQYLVIKDTITSVQYNCEDLQADGSKGDWNNFYNLPQSKKAQALADSIKGVGLKTAAGLVKYFEEGKPRSWKAFASLIVRAESELARQGYDTGWATQVIYRYKEDNIRNLGYLADDCKASVKTYTYSNRQLLGEKTALVKVKATNFSLLPGETETLRVTYDGKTIKTESTRNYNVVYSSAIYSDYGYRYNTSAIATFNSVQRLQVNPENLVDRSRSSLKRDGQLTLVHPRYQDMLRNSEFKKRCKITANVTLYGETGTFWNSKESPLTGTDAVELNLASGYTVIKLNANSLGKKDDALVKYTLQVAPGCPFFTSRPTLESIIEE
jgi:hypothetical protein